MTFDDVPMPLPRTTCLLLAHPAFDQLSGLLQDPFGKVTLKS